jgi:outer membrane protein TolC
MQSRASRNLFAATVVVGLTFVVLATGVGAGDSPLPPLAPVNPTVPAPVAPTGHVVRYHNLIPAQAVKPVEQEKAGKADKENHLKEVETGPELSLAECIAVAIERHPHLKAVKASTMSSETGFRSLMNFGTVGTLISPDLEIRKQQAQRGLAGAAGSYQKVHNEIVQDVTRMYYTAVYARQQQAIADDVVDRLEEIVDLISKILASAKTPDELGGLSTEKLLAAKIGLQEARQQQATAIIGRKRALAALRQAMAVNDISFPFRVKDTELPVMAQTAEITRQLVVDLALCRRPELALAAAGVDVFRLEVYAQGKIPFKRVVPTFASGADLHSRDIPQAMRGTEYRPGGIIPEMPTQLVGSKYDRVARAMAFSQKADAVFESAQSLIILEAENAFFEFQLASEKLRLAKEKHDLAAELAKLARKNLPVAKTGKEQFVQVEIVAAKAQSDYVEAVFQHLLSLAALERITAGGITPAFPGR